MNKKYLLSNIIPSQDVDSIRTLVKQFDRSTIISHVSPDGDAIGASLGLYHYLVKFGKMPDIVVPNGFPSFLFWMPGIDHVYTYTQSPDKVEILLSQADLIFVLDLNAVSRVEALGSMLISSSAIKVMIDHHLYPEMFCQTIISHPEISSTSELIFRLIYQMSGVDSITKEMAVCIYTGMMTDTGGFTYNSNSVEIYRIIAILIEVGIDKDEIYRNVYQNYTYERIRLQGYILSQCMKKYDCYPMTLITLSKEEASKFNCQKGDTEGFVNIPLSIKGNRLSVFMREDDDKIKISLRSSGTFPCNKLASKCFNGGGHLNASGGEFYGTMKDAVAKMEQFLSEFEEEFRK